MAYQTGGDRSSCSQHVFHASREKTTGPATRKGESTVGTGTTLVTVLRSKCPRPLSSASRPGSLFFTGVFSHTCGAFDVAGTEEMPEALGDIAMNWVEKLTSCLTSNREHRRISSPNKPGNSTTVSGMEIYQQNERRACECNSPTWTRERP